jgi:hypothetical protein
MRRLVETGLEALAIMLMPGVALAFFALVLLNALPTVHALIDALTTVPLWAQGYLVAAVALLLGIPYVALLSPVLRKPGGRLDSVLTGQYREGRR